MSTGIDRGFELLAGLDEESRRRVLALGERRHYACASEVFRLGDPADHLYLVEQGQVALMMPLSFKGEERNVLVEEEGRGQTVGWSALVAPHRFTLMARASVATDLVALPRVALRHLFAVDPAVAAVVLGNLITLIGQRLQKVQAMWIREVQRSVTARLAEA